MSEPLSERLRAYAKDQGGWLNIDDTCEEAADLIDALVEAGEKTVSAIESAWPGLGNFAPVTDLKAALARAKGEPK